MAVRDTMVAIDSEKLRAEIAKRGMTMIQASQEMGFANGFLSNCTIRGTMHRAAVAMLGTLYGIKPEAILPEEEPPDREPDTPGADYDMLHRVVYSAVYKAVKRAMSEDNGKDGR